MIKLNRNIKQSVPKQCIAYGFFFLLLFPSLLSAQDIHWSQFQSSPLNLNPAITGFFNGDYRFIGNHRSQWKSVTKHYSSFSGSLDASLGGLSTERNRYSAGLLFNNDKAGDGALGLTQFALSGSLIRTLDKNSVHFLSVGFQAGFVSRSINYSDLNFDEQYDGDVYDPNQPNSENFNNSKHSYPDISLGIAWLMQTEEKFKLGAGFSVQHINRPDDSFFSNPAKLFPRIQADIKTDFPVASRFDLVPSVLFMNQGSFNEFTGGTSVRYRISELPGRTYAFYLGGWFRQSDALIASAGIDYNNLNVGVSYDFNTSDLDRASNGKGGYEISLVYIIRKVKPIGIKPPCPLY